MAIGEGCNFCAYAFADAILVTPMGALSVVVTTILSAIFLKERLSFIGMVACFICIVGSVVIAVNAPSQSTVKDIQEFKHYVVAPGFLAYTGVVLAGAVFTALWLGPRYGSKNMFVYLTVCSTVGGLSVVSTQGLGSAIVAQAGGTPQFNQWFLYVVLIFVICTLLTEIIYLNVSPTVPSIFFLRSPTDINPHTESPKHIQHRPCHALLLRLLHLLYPSHKRHPLPRHQRHNPSRNHLHRPRLPPNLRRLRPPPALKIRKRRPRHQSSHSRIGANKRCGRTRRARE